MLLIGEYFLKYVRIYYFVNFIKIYKFYKNCLLQFFFSKGAPYFFSVQKKFFCWNNIMANSTTNSVRKAITARGMMIEAPFVHKEGQNNTPEHEIKFACAFPMRLDGRGAHFPNAKNWNHLHLKNRADPVMFNFQILLLMMESEAEGMVRPTVHYLDSPQEYQTLIEYCAKVKLGYATAEEKKYIQAHTTCDWQINLRFAHDVANVKERLRVLKVHNAKRKQKNGEKKKGKKNNDDVGEEGFGGPPPAARRPVEPVMVDPSFFRKSICLGPDSTTADAAEIETFTLDDMQRASKGIVDNIQYQRDISEYRDNLVPATVGEDGDPMDSIEGMPPRPV